MKNLWWRALGPVTLISLLLTGWLGLWVTPRAQQQGDFARLVYLHPAEAWVGIYVSFGTAVIASGLYLWPRTRRASLDLVAASAMEVSVVFLVLTLITGAIWGRPTWGTFWEWDGRMTSTLILFLIYLGIIALWRAFEDQGRAGRVIAVFTLVGALDIPVVKFSVDWWNTLHQPASFSLMGSQHMAPSMEVPLLVMTLAFAALFATLDLVAMRTEIYRRRAETLERQAAASLG